MFDHVIGHLTERTRDRLVSGTARKQPRRVKHLHISHTVSNTSRPPLPITLTLR